MVERTINIERLEQMTDIFGSFDENIGILERELGVTVLNRNTELKVVGDEERADRAVRVIESLLVLSSRGEGINEQNIRYAIGLVEENKEEQIAELSRDVICITVKGKPIKPKTIGQRDYINAIQNNTVTLGVGPAGTGKTYLAVALAVAAFKAHEIQRIILTRPAVEAGEKLGFLPGDLQNKVDPYLRPLYDALFEMFGQEAFNRHLERGSIEVAPLAYMRGRTLDDSFIILDEAQNTTPEQMKMFLTRLGFNSKAVITGDITQIDLPDGKSSGLRDAMRVLDGIEDVAMCMLSSKDVVRHVLVQRIINAYEKRDREREKKLQQIRKDNKNGRA